MPPLFFALWSALLLPVALATPSNVTFIPDTSPLWAFTPLDRWALVHAAGARAGTLHETKWGGATATLASPVNATLPSDAPTALGLLFGCGSSNGYARVTVNGQVVAEALNTFTPGPANYSHELRVPLNRSFFPNLPLWVLSFEATGRWQSGSKDSYVELQGVNVYFA